jgi:hypothetical protein
VEVVTGDCRSDTDSGTFVNGMVTKVDYHPFSNTLGFAYSTENGRYGVGVIDDVDLSSNGPSPGLLALREAGNRASRDIRTSAIMIGVFATSYVSIAMGPEFAAWYATLGEVGALGPGADRLNKIHHIFDNAAHNLSGLVQQYGSPAAAYDALVNATTS